MVTKKPAPRLVDVVIFGGLLKLCTLNNPKPNWPKRDIPLVRDSTFLTPKSVEINTGEDSEITPSIRWPFLNLFVDAEAYINNDSLKE